MALDLTQMPCSEEEAKDFREKFLYPLQRLNPAIVAEREKIMHWIEAHHNESVTTHDDSFDFRTSCLKLLAQVAQQKLDEYEKK